jgi:lipopolysaccharide transport system ATP-binding protein
VLFVSHNMAAIRSLTQRCLVLDRGQVRIDAPAATAIEVYLTQAAKNVSNGVFLREGSCLEQQPFQVKRVTTRRSLGAEAANQFDCDHPFVICVEYAATRRVPGLYGYINLIRSDGAVIYEGDSRDPGTNPLDGLATGDGTLLIQVPPRILGPGNYQIYVSFASLVDAAGPDIDAPGIVGQFTMDDSTTPRGNRRNGYLSTIFQWEICLR